MKPKIYVSGPMTGYFNKNYEAFFSASSKLKKRKYRVINPAELDKKDVKDTWEECLKRDIKALMECDAIGTLSGWENSRGALLEIYIAKQLKMPVHSINYFLKRK